MTAVYASTSPRWFSRLRSLPGPPSEVAFWRPTESRPKQIEIGDPWLFKEWGAPLVLGYGRYVEYESTTPSQIWERFGLASGAESLPGLIEDISAARQKATDGSTEIGNVVLSGFKAFDHPISVSDVGLPNLSTPFRYVPSASTVLGHIDSLGSLPPLPTAARRRELATEVYARNVGHVAHIRRLYEGRCQVTGELVLDGLAGDVTQVHHVTFLYQGGADDPANMISLSPNWHAIAHAEATNFDWATLEFVVGSQRFPLKLNRHLK